MPLGIPTLIIADDPQLITAARAAYAHWSAPAPAADPEIEIRLAIGSASSASVSFKVAVKGSCIRLSGEGVRGTADADAREGMATVSPQVASNQNLLADVCDTLLLFLLARSGRTPVHASAFILGEVAMVLAGPSGSGKSTLALAAADRGYPVLSDDMVFVQGEPSFAVWGFPRPIHVYPEDAPAGDHPVRRRNDKLKAVLPLRSPALRAEKTALLCLERGSALELAPIEPSAAVDRLMNLDAGFDLLEQDSRTALQALASRGSWQLTLGDDPRAAIDWVARHFAAR